MVYHYCDLNAFLNIIKTRKLWLSDVKKSNDSIEGKYLALLMLQSLDSGIKLGFYDDKVYEESNVLEAAETLNSFLNNKSFRKYIPKGYTIDSLEKIEKVIEQIAEGKSSILMYTTEDGITKVEVTFDNDTVWLSLDQIAELFQKNKSTISRHIKNIFSEGELLAEATVAKFATVQKEG
ncbi:hypothetical protein DFR60_10272 [Hungatella effluvii]|uniref:Uncharacterized protein n=1 Tax=Hungatella effluvii TaxID=1096246 RepID=A0A2V3Y9F7_9FIRM|nr:hypothetical protein DFR60_10272 [Hungatella effluvii]